MRLALPFLMLLAALTAGCGRVPAPGSNFVANAGLDRGRADTPDQWHVFGGGEGQGTTFTWRHSDGTPGTLEIDNRAPTPAGWRQNLYLPPGWYRVSAEMSVPASAVSLHQRIYLLVSQADGLNEPAPYIALDSGWHPAGFVLHEDRWGDTVEIAGLIAGPGQVSLRNFRVLQIGGPPAQGDDQVYDLAFIRHLIHMHDVPGGGADRTAGVLCGIGLGVLLAWGLAALWRPAFACGRDGIIAALLIILAVTVIKFALLPFFSGFAYDIAMKTRRALLAAWLGPAGIYDPALPVDTYPPASLYLLWLSGWIGTHLEPAATATRILVEAPVMLADALIALTLFFTARRQRRAPAAIAIMLAFALNPALLYDTVVWGQSDSVMVLPMLAGSFLIGRGRTRLGWAMIALAFLAKPQAVAIVPALAAFTLFTAAISEVLVSGAIAVLIVIAGFLPFLRGHGVAWIVSFYRAMGERFPRASMGAFNLHALLGGLSAGDQTTSPVGVSYFVLGIALLAALWIFAAWLLWRSSGAPRATAFILFLVLFGSFIVAPRMHERYAYVALVFLVPLILDDRIATGLYVALTATFLLNLVIAMTHAQSAPVAVRHDPYALGCAAANLLLLAIAVAHAFRLTSPPPSLAAKPEAPANLSA